jgi:hypothetical protein
MRRGFQTVVLVKSCCRKESTTRRATERRQERDTPHSRANFFATVPDLCYLFFVAQELHSSFFQHHLSSHEFFRLLSYTASYF